MPLALLLSLLLSGCKQRGECERACLRVARCKREAENGGPLLRGEKPPPADVDTSIPEASGRAPTLRARIAEHLSVPACAGCHGLVDPIGLALENFDGVGRLRQLDNGVPIDASGQIAGSSFDGPLEFAQILREHPALTPCLVQKMFRYATGRPEIDDGERALLDALHDTFAASGFDTLTLVRNIALSPGFRLATPREVSP